MCTEGVILTLVALVALHVLGTIDRDESQLARRDLLHSVRVHDLDLVDGGTWTAEISE